MEITVTEQFAQQLEILNQQLTELNQSNLVVRLKRLEDDTEYLKSVPHLIAIIEDIESYYAGAKQILTTAEACRYMGLSMIQPLRGWSSGTGKRSNISLGPALTLPTRSLQRMSASSFLGGRQGRVWTVIGVPSLIGRIGVVFRIVCQQLVDICQ